METLTYRPRPIVINMFHDLQDILDCYTRKNHFLSWEGVSQYLGTFLKDRVVFDVLLFQ